MKVDSKNHCSTTTEHWCPLDQKESKQCNTKLQAARWWVPVGQWDSGSFCLLWSLRFMSLLLKVQYVQLETVGASCCWGFITGCLRVTAQYSSLVNTDRRTHTHVWVFHDKITHVNIYVFLFTFFVWAWVFLGRTTYKNNNKDRLILLLGNVLYNWIRTLLTSQIYPQTLKQLSLAQLLVFHDGIT